MRDARAADWRRRLQTRHDDWATRLHRFAVTGVPSIGTLEVVIQSALTVFSGPNGVGKTTLLRAMWAALDPEASTPSILASRKLSAGSALVDLTAEGVNKTAEVSFGVTGPIVVGSSTVVVHHIDSAASTTAHQKAFCEFESVEEIVNGAGARELDNEKLAEISYIVHRQYRKVTLYEVELETVVPFFEVSYGNDQYDSRTMGAGELAALYIWWSITRAENNAVVLFEEPEAFLSFGSQKSLVNFIISKVVQKRLVAVISSHSAAFVSSLPKQCLAFFARTQSGVSAIIDRPPPVLLKEMGIEPATSIIIFVEDSMARLLCRAILEKCDALLSRQIHIEQCKGEGEIVAVLKPMLHLKSPIKFIGLFDGDMRGKVPEQFVKLAAFLPGVEPTETIFRRMVESNVLAQKGITDNPNISAIISSLEGKDHHDWYEELARELGLSRDQLFLSMFQIWIEEECNEKAAGETFVAIDAMLD